MHFFLFFSWAKVFEPIVKSIRENKRNPIDFFENTLDE
jgi:hypothetical protein